MAISEKARYWCGILYPENMREDWQSSIADVIQLPCVWILHNKDHLRKTEFDKDEHERKNHVHLMVAFDGPTTKNNVLKIFNKLSLDDLKCCSTVESVNSIRFMYNYFIHDTEQAKKDGKYLYDKNERHCCNNFDIGLYEQLSTVEKENMAKELCDLICDRNICNFVDFYKMVASEYDIKYFEIIKGYSGLFERLTKGNFQAMIRGAK